MLEMKIHGAKKISIQEAGHIMKMDKPEEFNRYISDFINGLK